MAAKRFAKARTLRLEAPAGRLEAFVAERFALRLRGLTGLGAAELSPLLFPRCRSIHSFGMATPIDCAFVVLPDPLGAGAIPVLEVVRGLRPWRATAVPRSRSADRSGCIGVLELAPGEATRLGIEPGSELAIGRPAASLSG